MSEFVCPPDHKHAAVSTCYIQHKCRCDSCGNASTARASRRRKDQAYGRFDTGLVDAEPVREHVEMLQAFGLGWKRIGELSGVGHTAVSSLIYGRKGSNSDPRKGEVLKRTSREKAEKILAVKPDLSLLAEGALVPSRGVHRRVQALVARGWSQSKVAQQVNFTRSNFGGMMHAPQVSAGLHRRVAALYEEWCMLEPPHEEWREKIAFNRSVNYAKARRWVPPLAWDDIDTDPEPPLAEDDGSVDEMAVELALSGEKVRLTPAERRVAVTRLHAERWSDARIGEAIGAADRTVFRIRQELGLEAFDQTELRQRGAA